MPVVQTPKTFGDLKTNYDAYTAAVSSDSAQLALDTKGLTETNTAISAAFSAAGVSELAQVNPDGTVTIISVNPAGGTAERVVASVDTPLPGSDPAPEPAPFPDPTPDPAPAPTPDPTPDPATDPAA